ncbi:MAG: glycosyltransferase family 2 protein [Kiritimatiellae bacterium]|nr:glycosyltransferase family 2 protein [Kiritimatiellia bacterium]
MDVRLSIVVPARNEERRLGRMLDAYLPFFRDRYGDAVEFIIVVNGSTDRTAELARRYAAQWPLVRVIEEPRPIGKGGAVMVGFRAARGERIGFVDADGATPPEAFEDLLHHFDGAGAVIANRWDPRSDILRQPWTRRLASRVFNAMVRLLFGLHTTDTQCGAKVLTRRAVEDVLPHLGITQWAFDVDLLFQLRRHGHRIVEVPTVWRDVGGSHVRVGKTGLEMFIAVVRLRLIYSPFRWIVRVYDHTLGRVIRHRV